MLDYLIKNGKLIDGTGSGWKYADVGIQNAKIEVVGPCKDMAASNVINAEDLIVCPGFIDMHAHTDIALLADYRMDYRLKQGVTTEVIGQDGLAYAPCSPTNLQFWRHYLSGLNGDFLADSDWNWTSVHDLLEKYKNKASNAALLIPHGAVRVEAMGWTNRTANADELKNMQQMVSIGMEQGAIGLSTGLTYVPCKYANTEEMTALCEPVAQKGGILSVHLRSYAQDFIKAIEEMLEVGRSTGCAIHLSHLRIADKLTWGKAHEVSDLLNQARSNGIDVTFDLYPYTVGNAPLFCLTPEWLQTEGPEKYLTQLRDKNTRQKAVEDLKNWKLDWSIYVLSNSPRIPLGDFEGRSIMAAAKSLQMEPEEFVLELLCQTELNTTIIATGGSEADNDVLFQHPCCMIGSDGILLGDHPHPRGFGTFPRVIREYVYRRKLLSLETAIFKMTGLPASRLNLGNRGLVRKGQAADLVIFNPQTICDQSTYSDGMTEPAGVQWVFVNGNCVVEESNYTGSQFGIPLKPLLI